MRLSEILGNKDFIERAQSALGSLGVEDVAAAILEDDDGEATSIFVATPAGLYVDDAASGRLLPWTEVRAPLPLAFAGISKMWSTVVVDLKEPAFKASANERQLDRFKELAEFGATCSRFVGARAPGTP